ncbi:MAG: ATP-dependent DNA ligase [Xanthobacteraceae bacterium]|nr:ATP-dependent DNA ligase [Xanthobacteraceae bacterium]
MALPLRMPYRPMESLPVDSIPVGPEWAYEPKWDGFRCLAFRDGKQIDLQSKAGKPLTRYFPELVAMLHALKADRFVLDGEIVVPSRGGFSFDALLQRLHPAASRIQRLASETPALLIVFDLLVNARGERLTHFALPERRKELKHFLSANGLGVKQLRLSPTTTRLASARAWLRRVGSGLDGVVAKRRDLPYLSGERAGMQKIKNYRSADCVVGGFRYNEGKDLVGSLLLGLYDDAGLLHHVGFSSTIARKDKPTLTKRLETYVKAPGFTGNAPGGRSRWSTERSGKWYPLKPKFVVEVCYDHFSGERFRHGTRLVRWRPDKAPRQCNLDQLLQKQANLLALLS